MLFADRELVILDEPTSALDPLQENRILEEFLRLSRGRTTIIISHRVGLCRQVDKIAVMQDGSIAEWGSHEQLMAEGGAYKNLYDMQSRWYTDTADAPGGMPVETGCPQKPAETGGRNQDDSHEADHETDQI